MFDCLQGFSFWVAKNRLIGDAVGYAQYEPEQSTSNNFANNWNMIEPINIEGYETVEWDMYPM